MSNTNESATVSVLQNFLELNKASIGGYDVSVYRTHWLEKGGGDGWELAVATERSSHEIKGSSQPVKS